MATLTSSDYRNIQQKIRSDPTARSTFKVWGLNKQEWYDLFQAAEDWFVNGFSTMPATSFKAALDAITTTTNAQAKQLGYVWMGWRFDVNP